MTNKKAPWYAATFYKFGRIERQSYHDATKMQTIHLATLNIDKILTAICVSAIYIIIFNEFNFKRYFHLGYSTMNINEIFP